jgi:hypothetical protein
MNFISDELDVFLGRKTRREVDMASDKQDTLICVFAGILFLGGSLLVPAGYRIWACIIAVIGALYLIAGVCIFFSSTYWKSAKKSIKKLNEGRK